jgi:purine-binding chemotaxis protein CheW
MTRARSEDQMVVFSLHGEHYALPITSVQEIIRYVAPSATAIASGLIRGMINLRGKTLPVVDLSPRLGGQLELGAATRILVVEVSGGSLGLVVDRVEGIMGIAADLIQPLPAAANREVGEEIAAVGDRLIVLIDPERALGELPAPARRPPARRPRTTPARPRTSS